MIAEITAMYLTNHERFYPFSTTAVVLCTELCDMIGISKKNRGAIKEKEMNDFLSSTSQSRFLSKNFDDNPGIGYEFPINERVAVGSIEYSLLSILDNPILFKIETLLGANCIP